MIEPRFEGARPSDPSYTPIGAVDVPDEIELTVPQQYELLLGKLARAERELAAGNTAGRTRYLEEASVVVFDLLYHLDFKHGGELVPRLAGLYGYVANELLNVGRSGDLTKLRHVQDMIRSLRRSWDDDGPDGGKKLPFKNEVASPILDGGGK
jgi:flagellar biosynthetic protein FliS